MPYKVLIADDEPMIRYGLTACVQWEKEGLVLAGEASNGAAALDLIRVEPVDILITDIKMPLMDGLELTRQAKQLRPHIKVILVSSYSDFEYAREAVKLGVVVDYLLKPVMEPEDLLRILQQCKAMLYEEHARLQASILFLEEATNKKRLELEAALRKMLNGETIRLPWQPEWMKDPFVVSVWRQECGSPANSTGTPLNHLLEAESVKEKLLQRFDRCMTIVSGEQECVSVLSDENGSAIANLERFHASLTASTAVCYTVGVSPPIHTPDGLPDAYNWAKKALDISFFAGIGKCYAGVIEIRKGASSSRATEAEDRHDERKKRWQELREQFMQRYAIADKEQCVKILERIWSSWRDHSLTREQTLLQAQNLLILMASGNIRPKAEETMNRTIDKLQRIQEIGTLDELCRYLRNEFDTMWETDFIPVLSDDSGGAHSIHSALSYIQEHFRGELSLQEVADFVHMSKNYFSEQFKRRTGLNFIDFVIRLRLNYAKLLLRNTTLRVYDVGNKSGFADTKHFLKLFKREVKCTPAEYRQGTGRESANRSRNR